MTLADESGLAMFDLNDFKAKVRMWLASHATIDEQDLVDYCEELIPPQHYAANHWIIDQTVEWYRHMVQTGVYDTAEEVD